MGKKKEEEAPPPDQLPYDQWERWAGSVIAMLEAIRLEVRASAEETVLARGDLRAESNAISARVLGNG